jgi:hypothetical protein
VHVVPVHAAPVLRVVSQVLPQPAQLAVVLVAVSQPARSGAVVVQLAKPALQLVYVHVVPPLHAAPLLARVSQARPHPEQLLVVLIGVSQPLTSVPEVSQLEKPAAHPV